MKFGLFGKALLLASVLSFGGVRAELEYGPDVYTAGIGHYVTHRTEQEIFAKIRSLHVIKSKLAENPALKEEANALSSEIFQHFSNLRSLYLRSKRWENPDEQKIKDFWHDQWDPQQPTATFAALQEMRIVEEIVRCSVDQIALDQNSTITERTKERLQRARQKTCGRDVYQLFRAYEKLVRAEAELAK